MVIDADISAMYNLMIECPITVGRASELAILYQAIDHMQASSGQVILISGEAGLGKSRLVAETKAYAAGHDFALFQGRCYQEDISTPYAPLIDLLHPLFAGHAAASFPADTEPVARELLRLLPDIAPLIAEAESVPTWDPEQKKRRLFTFLSQFLTMQSEYKPLLLVVEDLHWSDDSSLEFLLYLARRSASLPIVLLLTYRNDEPLPGLAWLAQFDRERLAYEMTLERLTRDEVDAMIRAIFGLGHPVRVEFLDTIYTLTEGNPFFVEEVLKSLIVSGDIYLTGQGWNRKPVSELRIPRSVQGAVQQRVAQLTPAARRLLHLAAIAGRRFDFALLQELSHHDEPELLRLIKELVAAQLVVGETSERFAFRHALTREAIYAEMLARERKAHHQMIGDSIERRYADSAGSHVADLAYHYYKAEDWAKALEYCVRAGERAQALYTPGAVVEHITRALHAAGELALTPPAGVYRLRGRAYELLGDFEPARADYEVARQVSRTDEARRTEWATLLDLGKLWASRDYAIAGAYFQEGLALARTLDDPSIVAHSLNRLGNWHLNIERPREARQCHTEALRIFQELNNRPGVAETLDLLGMSSYLGGDLIGGTDYYRRAVALFRELDDRQGLASSLATLTLRGGGYQTSTMITASPDLVKATAEGEEAVAIARDIGWRPGEAHALIVLGFCLGAQGQYTRALELVREALTIAEEIEHRQWMTHSYCALGALHLDLLDLTKAQQYLEQALALAQQISSSHWIHCATGYLASTYVLQHEHTKAEVALDAVLAPVMELEALGQRLAWCARAELALARNEPHLALQIVEALMASAAPPEHHKGQVIPRLWRLRGEALAALTSGEDEADRRLSEAETLFQAALETAITQEAWPQVWRLNAALGKLHHRQARQREAEQAYVGARSGIEALAAGLQDQSLRRRFLRRAFTMLPLTQRHSKRRITRRSAGGLTMREYEVAIQIAHGKTNREIAEELIVSERTIETHVTHILSKLGFTSRRQVAAWVMEQGLLNGGEQ
jgi:DNA-binding CsgD family transcriptional regulator/tetratricopeptide (TPR) repeat protein